MCEAFLRVTPHFGLWLKTFEVKLKMIEGQHAECGGASIHKMTGAAWPKGSIPEVSRLWQREWFYITAPRSAKWAAAPTFRSGPPPQLMSWISRGLSWGPAKDVPILQSRIQDLFEGDLNLVVQYKLCWFVKSSLANAGPFACGSSTQRDHVPFKVSLA